ncbi:four helix bundle protein [Fodinibius saliphilus]|uniref:four helix bundle protein n=1 Tax=Fodinibius saliphilus TaxID=1920650 RepID=UPI00110A0825|nr:four helix bundle protein [Fodinibius saliphilus]
MNKTIDFDSVDRLKERTKKLALAIIKLNKTLPKTEEAKVIGHQLLRCGTSVGANYRAACRARSDRAFYAKLCIVVEEADEVLFWLKLVMESGLKRKNQIETLVSEAKEILAIMAAFRKTVGKRLKN